MKLNIIISLILLFFLQLQAQENLLAELESSKETKEYSLPAFKTLKIANLQSTKLASKGDLYFMVSHRFGNIKDGMETFYGLDNAYTKLALLYGLFKRVQIGLSRETFRKTVGGSIKIKLLEQTQNMPVSMAIYSDVNINFELKKKIYPLLEFYDRLSYTTHLLISRRVTSKLSLLVAPTYVRQNLEYTPGHDHDQFALGVGGRYKLSKRLSFNMDYVHNFVRHALSKFNNPLTIGLDIETGGHVFQVLLSNAQSSNETAIIANALGDWSKGEVFFGFNLMRVF